MPRYVVLDAGPLNLASMPPSASANAAACHSWLAAVEAAGAIVVVPAVVDYEVRRDLVRRGAAVQLGRLNGLVNRLDYLPVSSAAWLRAADLWAYLRRVGLPTADALSLDADAVIAGQALTLAPTGDRVTVATTNVGHLARFPGVDARDWRQIT